ncbi:hypothetical protein D3C83_54890 [compost metagenome]
MLGWAVESSIGARPLRAPARALLLASALAVGGSTVLFGPESAANLAALAAGIALSGILALSLPRAR